MTDRSDLTQRITDVLLSYGSNIGATHYRSVAEEIVTVLSQPELERTAAECFHDRLKESCQPMRDPYHSDPSDPT